MSYTGTVIVIPTRNRATIVVNAIRSVLEQTVENISLLVSDNSTSEKDRETLATFCSAHTDNRLRYIRPQQLLPMTEHWDWAIREALQLYPASHFLYLTDRMMFRKGSLSQVLKLATLYPDKVISYNHDRIIDNARPIRVEQYPASEKLLEVSTLRLSWLLSQSIFHAALPRMLNCVVPRSVLERIYERFGNVFSSICPDFNFCCRCLDMEDSILFYDQAPIFHYALNRSNGASVSRGELTPDNVDFTANLPVSNSIRNYATPIPQLNTAINAGFNEYLVFKQQTNSERFFEVDLQKYLQANAEEIKQVSDPQLRSETLSLLVAEGYEEQVNGHHDSAAFSLRNRLESKIKRILTGPATTPVWLFAARTLGIKPPGENLFEFTTLDDAIEYSENLSSGNFKKQRSREELLMAREIPKQ